jgi:hypothetical protein
LALADLIIRVEGGPPLRTQILSRTNDPETAPDVTVPGPNGKQKVNIPFNSTEGTLIAQDWTGDSFFDIWLDIAGDQTQVDAAFALLLAQSNDTIDPDYMVELSPEQEFEPDWPVDYDIHVRMALTPGPDQTFDFDFGAAGPVVANIGIPEPSSVVLSAMALVGLAFYGWRRRRSA